MKMVNFCVYMCVYVEMESSGFLEESVVVDVGLGVFVYKIKKGFMILMID